ncbi:MAG: CapA family protein, partial [Lachnospiraceae bacterium]|nr:CapA family protein [Lachnospiraceae bacterium]
AAGDGDSAKSAPVTGEWGSAESGQAAAETGSALPGQAAADSGSAVSGQAAADTGSAASDQTTGGTGNAESVQKESMAGNARSGQGEASGESAAELKVEDGEAPTRMARLSDFQETPHTPDVKSMLRQRLHALEEKGFGKKQQTIAGIGVMAALLVVVLIVCAVSGTIRRQAKQKYVTADEGLTILVDNQPDEWCNSCELELKIKVKSGTISSIEIDGTAYEADSKGRVTVPVESALVNVTVVTENDTLTAKIEIPKLDADAPVLSVDKSQGEITVTAADARSGLAGICYAAVEDDDWLQLPIYQEYSEPIVYEEGKIYYFYASDEAGNRSTPLVTNMIEAESAALSDTELTILVGETASLELSVTPSNAYLTNVTFESSNTDVVTVTSAGLVTAVAEGGALIRVSADDIETITCTVTVETEQTVTVSAIGDCTLGTYAGMTYTTNFNTYYSSYGASYFFENVRDILENDDITFANLEGPLTDETTAVEKEFAFKGDPAYTSILLDGSIEVVTLANNHSSDYGAQSLADTKENLTAAGIDYCIGDTIAYQEVSGVKVAFIGIYELSSGMDCESQVRETIAEAQSEGAQLIIVAFHWGTEKSNTPDETQQALAHIAIDCGADLVVGHHPHVLQGIEKYNGKYIVYSLGNFCFGGNTNPSDKDTMIFRQTFTRTADGVVEADAIEIFPCTISSTSSYNDYRPTPATGEDADAIMERINEYSAAFGDITYVASDGL